MISMGPIAKAFAAYRCPWSYVVADSVIQRWLASYSMLKQHPTLPQPGLADPQFHQALAVIGRIISTLDEEEVSR
jgi:hypothetical protein